MWWVIKFSQFYLLNGILFNLYDRGIFEKKIKKVKKILVFY